MTTHLDISANLRNKAVIIVMCVAMVVLAIANVVFGSVNIPLDQIVSILTGGECEKESWRYIILESRLPQTVTAAFCGASLAVSGLLLQTCFHNPLAGPSILGITNGASLGVAIVMLVFGGVIDVSLSVAEGSIVGSMAVVAAAFAGSMAIIAMLLVLTSYVKNNLMLLIVGIMVSYLTSSIVSLCNFFANADNVHSYVMWGMGSFSDVGRQQLPLFSGLCICGLLLAAMLTKSLNLLLLGEQYAMNLGTNIRQTRRLILIATGILTAVATAFCGPVAFIGLAVPHIARLITKTANHAILTPATILCGAVIALLCNLICILPENTIIPLNAVTPIFGAPVIIYIIFRKR